ncbi:Uncharacterized protein OS=Singulisphaera acidiphila (strain ATCC BAA-1392 / DSM 18658 / VKM B-2454 / MOB10) GN=Sinac_7624 PE=4 SV=1 [Gemmata massiliana]|uniref:Uncharacterized protein n=1 Tax=Gemmata massiliana TaxID=1210884 RepID=A0A6P2CVB3_9BACT|nr:hypothetical protein [Gemmata massiliana]VTR92843.1 Uncharacterized protein OS=Singulisphaera acidiphila (strain ATCC BAA-1392 / DSM 18658 / VKM B-2454 / MOB10) GN=Sinac_7624 PE=4 SV=1 [Gemmata massiliana]
MASTKAALPPAEVEVPKTMEELRALLKRTQAGDETTVPVVRKMLSNPASLRMFGGKLADQVVSSFIKAMGGDNVGFREAVLKKLEQMRAELLGESSTPIERVLVERVVACWLQVQDAELRAAQGQKDASIKQADFHQRRMDATNKRFLAAVKGLALVRKFAVPVLQVNIAKKQVNVAAPVAVHAG